MFEYLGSIAGGDSAFSFLRVLEYITVRSALALGFSFLFCVVFGPWVIRRLQQLQAIQYIRNDNGGDAISLQEMHETKAGTPSMGGLLMFGAILASAALFSDWTQPVALLAIFMMAGFCAIGFADDYLKMVKKNADGLSVRKKLLAQCALGSAFALVYTYGYGGLVSYEVTGTTGFAGPTFLLFPFFKNLVINLGLFFVPFAVIVLMATSNAVNLTDGLDGLAAGVTVSVTLCFALVAYLTGRIDATEYLIIPHVRGAGELTVLLSALTGSCLGFLWFNSHPAEMFMGDTGSMMLGGLLGTVALLIKQEFLLLVVGGVFVAEAASVILQVGSYKLRRKRMFRMAPLHHHFERGGLPESKIIARFWIVSALLALAGLVTLKFR